MRSLKRISNQRKKKEVLFGVCDIEVDNWVNFLCIGFYEGHNDVYRWFDNLDEFLDFTFDHCQKNKIDSVFAHFGGKFDFNFILRAALSSKKYTIGSMIPRSSSILCFDLMKVKRGLKPKEWPKITFRDSSALLPFGLGTLTNIFDVKTKKGSIDFSKLGEMWKDKEGRKEVLAYLESDNRGLWQVLDTFYSQDMIAAAGPAFTTASQALKVYQTYMSKDLVIKSLPENVDEFIREGYFGGRTEVFKPIFDSTGNLKSFFEKQVKVNDSIFTPKLDSKAKRELERQIKSKTLYYLDVNSLFPFCMWKFEFPISFMFSSKYAEDYDPSGMGFWEITVDVPKNMFCPPLGKKHEVNGGEKLIFPTGKFKGIWSIAEIEYAKSIGVEVLEYHQGVILNNGGKIFSKYINDLYNKRLEAKNAGDEATSLLVKLMMNSTYGKFGQTMKDKESIVLDKGQEGLTPHSEVKVKGSRGIVRLGTVKKDMKNGFSNVAIAAYVTSYARIHMHKIYMKAGRKHLFYTDTDSIFSTKPFPTGDKLGQLKLEHTCESACFLLPKTYINEGVKGEKFTKKLTMKGFDKKKISRFTFDDFRQCLYGDMKRMTVFQTPKFATLKTALRKGQFVCMAFDPDTEEKLARKKHDELIRRIEILTNRVERIENPDSKKENKKEIIKLKSQARLLKKKIESGFEASTRSIQSQYDKRICSKDGLFSDPIHINEISQ